MDLLTGSLVAAIFGVSVFQMAMFLIAHGADNWFNPNWGLPEIVKASDICGLILSLVRLCFTMRVIFAVDHVTPFTAPRLVNHGSMEIE